MKTASQGWLTALAGVVALVAAVTIFVRDAPDISLEKGTLRAPATEGRLSIAVGAPARPDLDPIFPFTVEESTDAPLVAVVSGGIPERRGTAAGDEPDEGTTASPQGPAGEAGAAANEVGAAGCPRGSARAEEQTTSGRQQPRRPSNPACPHDGTRAGGGPARSVKASPRGPGERT
ncbi:MAG: hypothetical protein GEU78_05925 [Actinobacteria bacterium]|nr:hypothetical protein [Actinomycetota bacterium]